LCGQRRKRRVERRTGAPHRPRASDHAGSVPVSRPSQESDYSAIIVTRLVSFRHDSAAPTEIFPSRFTCNAKISLCSITTRCPQRKVKSELHNSWPFPAGDRSGRNRVPRAVSSRAKSRSASVGGRGRGAVKAGLEPPHTWRPPVASADAIVRGDGDLNPEGAFSVIRFIPFE
jgi:hypothetical protein